MSVKIFLPVERFYAKENCDIYGEVQISESNGISYFVIAACANNSPSCQRLRHLGHIARADTATELQRRDVSLSFTFDAVTPNIWLDRLSIKLPHTTHVNVFLYNAQRMLQLHGAVATKCSAAEQCDDIRMLYKLLQEYKRRANTARISERTVGSRLCAALNFPLELMTRFFILLMDWKPVVFILRQTVLYEHYQEWLKFRATRQRTANITLDKILGICVMLLLLLYIPHPGDYLIQMSHFIIKELRLLLRSLKGSPIGLKLNVHLNNLFLDCFNYHVDLWAAFLNLIEPLVRELFVPIALLGSMGLSYQLALLADLISVIGLHAHCFYIYAAVLYKVEIKGLQVLWKVVRGKRRNLLKNRVESHNYMNRQLYLATIFFTSLLFLFPTILVYYIVFTTLRLCIYLVNLVLQLMRRRILEFPLQILFKWLQGNFFEMESIQLQYTHHVPSPQPEVTQMRMSVFNVNVQSSTLGRAFSCESGVLQELTALEQTSLKSIFSRILEGKF